MGTATKLATIAACLACGAAMAGKVPPSEPRLRPVAGLPANSICIIENRDTRSTFLDAYREALAERGLKVAIIREPATLYDCPMTSTYVGSWASDQFIGFIYSIDYARLNVYREGRLIGYAMWQRPNGYVIRNGENKVRELVGELFPETRP